MIHKLKCVTVCLLIGIANPVAALGEKVPFAFLKKLLPENPIILEAGAQFGEDTSWMSEMWPQGKIFAFEPSSESYPALVKVSEKYNNISVEQLALSNKTGKHPFYLAGGASSLLQPSPEINRVYFHADLEHPAIVEVTTLDAWAQSKGISKIDFMWLDMEGNELNALKGGLSILKTVKVIYTEVNLQTFWNDCVLVAELTSWLEAHGFEKMWEDIAPNWHGNILFVNNNL